MQICSPLPAPNYDSVGVWGGAQESVKTLTQAIPLHGQVWADKTDKQGAGQQMVNHTSPSPTVNCMGEKSKVALKLRRLHLRTLKLFVNVSNILNSLNF